MSTWLPVSDPRFDGAPANFRAAVSLQVAYWRRDPASIDRLAPLLSTLSWRHRLRLHHLLCLELLEVSPGDEADIDALGSARAALFRELLGLLVSPESPWRPRTAAIWLGQPSPGAPRPPTAQGLLVNASLTHLGAVEIIRLDEDEAPTALDFVPLDDLLSLVAAGQSLFRAARVFTVDAHHGPTVWLPLLYGTSWRSAEPSDRDGIVRRLRELNAERAAEEAAEG